jgi:hypothetical protein
MPVTARSVARIEEVREREGAFARSPRRPLPQTNEFAADKVSDLEGFRAHGRV